jgi:(p)ppGpp synthase/HD superfamily hydrolase
MNSPAYIHSLRVYELLKNHGFDEDTQLAGLLHDIIEDS